MAWMTALRHFLLHDDDVMIERGDGEVYTRCLKCHRRSAGLRTGPLKVTLKFAGDPDRHKLRVPHAGIFPVNGKIHPFDERFVAEKKVRQR
jgi:hypothetical protein